MGEIVVPGEKPERVETLPAVDPAPQKAPVEPSPTREPVPA